MSEPSTEALRGPLAASAVSLNQTRSRAYDRAAAEHLKEVDAVRSAIREAAVKAYASLQAFYEAVAADDAIGATSFYTVRNALVLGSKVQRGTTKIIKAAAEHLDARLAGAGR